jgi:molybdopterin molybdotransferase
MLSPEEALARILERVGHAAATESVPLASAAGRCLAQETVSDVDLPPFEKSMMDGFALSSRDIAGSGHGPWRLRVVGESRAGAPCASALRSGECIEIFTGAELPAALDTVLMVEHAQREGDWVSFSRRPAPGENVSHRGEILRTGQRVHAPRRRLSPADLSVLASIGCDPVRVFRRPRVSVLTTGDELVPPARRPGPGQIREGNTLFLAAACAGLGCEVVRSGIVRDDPAALAQAFGQALEDSDVLLTTGGVSVGKYDLVGAAFEALGVEPVLHKVAVKPGKPIWFGMRGAQPVFGLPGNPVSTLLGFEVFVRAALVRLAGDDPALEAERIARGRWLGARERGGERQVNLPVRVRAGADGVPELEPVPHRGSADNLAAACADGLAIVPIGGELRPGALADYRPLRYTPSG